MIKNIWRKFFAPVAPPWEQPRELDQLHPQYQLLCDRLAFMETPALLKVQVLGLRLDRKTGQIWEDFIVEDGPAPFYGIRPFELPGEKQEN